MRFENVPPVVVRYWVTITLASVLGFNAGDCISYYAGWNHWIGLLPLAVAFAALLYTERRSGRATPAWYWAVVIVLRAAATNLADLATHTFAWPYLRVILGLVVLQALFVWPLSARMVAPGIDRTSRPSPTGWYWLSLLTAGKLGTAIGDWVAGAVELWRYVIGVDDVLRFRAKAGEVSVEERRIGEGIEQARNTDAMILSAYHAARYRAMGVEFAFTTGFNR